jgi:hypothetical protein
MPGATRNRDDLQRGIDTLIELFAKAELIRDQVDVVEIVKAMLHWAYVFRDIANIEICILEAIQDQSRCRTLQKTHAHMIFAFLERWPNLIDAKDLAAVRKRFPDLGEMADTTKAAFTKFNARWGSHLSRLRHNASGHYKDAIEMQMIWRELSFKSFLDLFTDFRALEEVFLPYVTETIGKVGKIVDRHVQRKAFSS